MGEKYRIIAQITGTYKGQYRLKAQIVRNYKRKYKSYHI